MMNSDLKTVCYDLPGLFTISLIPSMVVSKRGLFNPITHLLTVLLRCATIFALTQLFTLRQEASLLDVVDQACGLFTAEEVKLVLHQLLRPQDAS